MAFTALFLSLGGGEIFFILLIILLLFGSKSLPDIARGIGKGVKEFKKATTDIQREFKVADEVQETVKKVKHQIRETGEQLKSQVNENEIIKQATEFKEKIDPANKSSNTQPPKPE